MGGAAGLDGQSIEEFERDLKKNLYRIWNGISFGNYFPPPVRTVKIPKPNGEAKTLGIPTVSDRIAQMVVKSRLEAVVDPLFLPASYGYRLGKGAGCGGAGAADVPGPITGYTTWTSRASSTKARRSPYACLRLRRR